MPFTEIPGPMQHDLIDNITLTFKKGGAKVNASPILEGARLIISCLTSAFAWSDPVATPLRSQPAGPGGADSSTNPLNPWRFVDLEAVETSNRRDPNGAIEDSPRSP